MKNGKLVHLAIILFVVIATSAILYFGRSFLAPLAFAMIVATLLLPLLHQLKKRGSPEWLAISVCIATFLLVVSMMGGILTLQVKNLSEQWPQIQQRTAQMKRNAQDYITTQFGVSEKSQDKQVDNILKDAKNSLSWLFGSVFKLLSNAFLVLIYVILFLMERKRFLAFAKKAVPPSEAEKMEATLREAAQVSGSYLLGKLKVMALLAIIYAVGFLVGGVPNAVLLALLAALFSIIPYVGNIIGGGAAVVLAALGGGGLTAALIVVGVMGLAQVVESYILQPWIVGEEIDLNPWTTVVAVVGFGLIWGVMGAVLALPLVGMLKVFADHFPMLQPLQILISNEKIDDTK